MQEQSDNGSAAKAGFPKSGFGRIEQAWALRYGRYKDELDERAGEGVKRFRREIRKEMRLRGMNPNDLAVRVGVSSGVLYKFFRKETSPRLQTAVRIAAVLNLKIPEIEAPKI